MADLVEAYSTDAMGRVKAFDAAASAKAAPTATTVLFTGRVFDAETGLYYFRSRYFEPELGVFVSRDPLGFVDGCAVYQGWMAFGFDTDATGENRDSEGYTVKGTGHHIIPVQLWAEFGFPDEAKAIFDDATIACDHHNQLAHGDKYGYTAHVKDELAKAMQGKTALTIEEHVALAQKLVQDVKTSANPYIKGFLHNVSIQDNLRRWKTAVGDALPKPQNLPAFKLSIAKIELPGACKLGRKTPIVKYLFLLGVSYLWTADYNNARADGSSPAGAATIATARAADPGIEGAFDFGWWVGGGG